MTAKEIRRRLNMADSDVVFEYEERALNAELDAKLLAIIESCWGKSRIAAEGAAGDMVLGGKEAE